LELFEKNAIYILLPTNFLANLILLKNKVVLH